MTPNFEPDPLVSEAYDDTEQGFAASLESPAQLSSPAASTDPFHGSDRRPDQTESLTSVKSDSPPSTTSAKDPNAWREEVAARLNSYRARRRPRAPRYPSLSLKFEQPEERFAVQSKDRVASQALSITEQPVAATLEPLLHYAPLESGKIIEFPRLWEPPVPSPDELAEPVFDQPRILEAPEVVPPPPALGGILIEAEREPEQAKQPGIDIPLRSAPMSQRVAATATDAVLVLIAFAVFATVFFKTTAIVPQTQLTMTTSALLLGLFWSAYQFLMLIYTGSTPGMKLAKLQLSRFDGTAVPRSLRRWRAVASVLSGVSLGLGYAWCFLDEDALCWHDRITRTYLAPVAPASRRLS